MKRLVKETAKFEGLKSEVKIGNLREVVKVITAVLAADISLYGPESQIVNEYNDSITKMRFKASKICLKNTSISRDELVKKLLGRK